MLQNKTELQKYRFFLSWRCNVLSLRQIVCQSVLYKTLETYRDCETRAGGDLVKALLCVHFTYNTLALRLSYFRDMNAVWPNCSAAILEVKAKDPDDQMFTEQEFVSISCHKE